MEHNNQPGAPENTAALLQAYDDTLASATSAYLQGRIDKSAFETTCKDAWRRVHGPEVEGTELRVALSGDRVVVGFVVISS